VETHFLIEELMNIERGDPSYNNTNEDNLIFVNSEDEEPISLDMI
jgi:hypothetical protein